MDLDQYIIDHSIYDWGTLLQEWRWLLPHQFKVGLMTRMGDLFIITPQNSVYMLDVGAGTLNLVAISRDEFVNKLDKPEISEDWLLSPIVDRLVANGRTLGVGQCYSYRQLPTLGGSCMPDNFTPRNVHDHFKAFGTLQKKVANAKPKSDPNNIRPSNFPQASASKYPNSPSSNFPGAPGSKYPGAPGSNFPR